MTEVREARLLTASGRIYAASSGRVTAPGLEACAERIALWDAVLDGEREFVRLAVEGPKSTDSVSPPCGACLQVIVEFAPDLRIDWAARSGDEIPFPARLRRQLKARKFAGGVRALDLLPGAFGPRSLSRRASGTR